MGENAPLSFTYAALPWSIVFETGGLAMLRDHMDTLAFKRALVLTTPNQADAGREVMAIIGERAAGLYDQAAMHVPVEVVEDAAARAQALAVDCTIAIGGGSTTGLGKALAALHDIPFISVPTSFAGSEMTNIYGITRGDVKETKRDVKVVPRLTLYDANLIASLPPAFAAASGLNAMAQAVVNIATDKYNPIVGALALDAVRALAVSLPRILKDPADTAARAEALYGACLAGASLGTGQTSLHHRLCHTLGGALNTPHAETHAILLPHSVAYNALGAAEGTARLAGALGCDNAAEGLYGLLGTLNLPNGLDAIGVGEADVPRLVEMALKNPLVNPEPVTPEALHALLLRAVRGEPPASPQC